MPTFSRRLFMKRGGIVAAAAVAAPALPSLLSTSSAEAPEVEGDATATASQSSASLAQPLVAQVKNLGTGEMSIYSGEQEITYRDPEMASRLARAAASTP